MPVIMQNNVQNNALLINSRGASLCYIASLRKPRQEDYEFDVSLTYMMSSRVACVPQHPFSNAKVSVLKLS